MSRLWLHTAARHPSGPAWLHADCGEDLPSTVMRANYFADPDGQAGAGDWIMAKCHGGEVHLLLVISDVNPIKTVLLADSRRGIVPGRRRA